MSSPDGSVSSSAKSALRCVIWHSAAAALPGELLSSLSKRIGHMSVTTDGYSAFAELCKIERDRRVALAAHVPPPAAAVLLLVHPPTLSDAAAVVESARLYAPTCTIWQYDRVPGIHGQGTNPKLRSVVEEDVRLWSAPARATPTPAAPAAQPRPPVTPPTTNGKHHPSPTPALTITSSAPRPASPIAPALTQLTEDELRMLLSDEPIFPPTTHTPQRGGRR